MRLREHILEYSPHCSLVFAQRLRVWGTEDHEDLVVKAMARVGLTRQRPHWVEEWVSELLLKLPPKAPYQ